MRRRRAGLALASLALLLAVPSSASAGGMRSAAVEDYNVLVVTSTQDDVTAAGVAALQSAGASGGFTVTAPSPAEVGAQFTPANLEGYQTVVFLATGIASPLTDQQRSNFEDYFRNGGGFVGIGSAIETDASWAFLDELLGTRSSGRTVAQSADVKVADRVHDATKDLAEYWTRNDHWYNFSENVRGVSHVLASVVEDPFGPQPQGNVLDGIVGGTMGADHPISWCKDYRGGRSFYTGLGNTAAAFDADLTKHLKGAVAWAAGFADATYSDCGATVLANFQQVKISGPPNLDEPIGFDQLPDGRIIQTARGGTVRLHNPTTGTTEVIADFSDASLPTTMRIYTHSEDGLYGPAVDNDFATNKWVYLYYSPQTVTDVKLSDGSVVTQTTPNSNPPNAAPSKTAWDPYVGYFQLSRFKFVEDAGGAHLDLGTEQQIMRVPVNRQECCHVAGDIDFDKHNNLWLVTGDDTPAGGINGGGFAPANDQLTDEEQLVRVNGATGGTFTLTFKGQTTAPIAYDAPRDAIDAALEALSNVGTNDIQVAGSGAVNTGDVSVYFRRALQQSDQPQITADGAGLTGGSVITSTDQEGGWYQRPTGDSRRGAGNTNDLRGKALRIAVKSGDIAAGAANKADFGSGSGAYTIPAGNLFPLVAGAPQAKTRAEVYAMGFRNPFRIQVDSNDVAYISDYSPDSQTPQRSRGPAGTGRYEIVRHPANYGWPECYSSKLGYYRWNFHEFAPGTTSSGTPLDDPPQPIVCDGTTQLNDSRWNLEGGPSVEPGLRNVPPVTDPDIWYSYRDNNANTPLGTPCFGYYATEPGEIAPGSTTECPRLFPELYTGGVAPHGIDVYEFDADNPNPAKFPPYYDGSVIIGEFGQDTMREVKLDSQNRVMKINPFLDCSAVGASAAFDCDNPMDMQFGDDGTFYLLTYGDGFFRPNPDAGMYRWDYAKGQRNPVAVLTTDKTDGPTPLTVQFSSEGTADPDPGDSIVLEWDFGDGTTSMDPNPSHTYTTPGRYTAVLTVTDSSGKTGAQSTVITAGNTSPSISINLPLEGSTFAFGDAIPFSVSVTDPEDGTVNCNDIQVTFVLGHDEHGHAEATTTGCTGTLPTERRRRLARGQRVRRHQRPLRGQGRPGRCPVADDDRERGDPPAPAAGGAPRQPGQHEPGADRRHRRRRASHQPGQQQLDPAQRPVQPDQHRLGDVPGARQHPARARDAAGGDRGPHRVARRPDRAHREPDVDRRRVAEPDVPDRPRWAARAVPRVPVGARWPGRREHVRVQLARVQRPGRAGWHPGPRGRPGRRHGPADAVARARSVAELRRVHPGRGEDVRGQHDRDRDLDRRRRHPERLGPELKRDRAPRQRVLLAGGSAHGQGRERGRHRRRGVRPRGRQFQPDQPADVRRAGLQRPGDRVVRAVDRRQGAAAHRQLLQDADVHAVDDDTVT